MTFWVLIQSMLTAAGKKDKKKLIIKIFPSHYVCERRKNKANETVVSIIDVFSKIKEGISLLALNFAAIQMSKMFCNVTK